MSRVKWLSIMVAVLSIAAALLAFHPAPARAAAEPAGYKSVWVRVDPEYDQPGVLTIIEGQIDGATPPVQVKFLVPATAEMNSAGSESAIGAPNTYQRAPDWTGGSSNIQPSDIPGWNVVSFELTTNVFRVEYYDSSIQGFPDKTISYDFRTIYPITNLTLSLQEPKGSSNYVVNPASQSIGTDADGLRIHQYSFATIAANSDTHFDISYTKASSTPSFPQSGAASRGSSSGLTWLWVALGVAAIAVVAYLVMRGNRRRVVPVRARSSRRAATRAQAASQGGGGNRFCTGCGNRVSGAVKFCPNCGKKL